MPTYQYLNWGDVGEHRPLSFQKRDNESKLLEVVGETPIAGWVRVSDDHTLGCGGPQYVVSRLMRCSSDMDMVEKVRRQPAWHCNDSASSQHDTTLPSLPLPLPLPAAAPNTHFSTLTGAAWRRSSARKVIAGLSSVIRPVLDHFFSGSGHVTI